MSKVGSFAVVMHDASLFTFAVPLKGIDWTADAKWLVSLFAFAVPLKGIRTFEALLPLILVRISKLFSQIGILFDAKNQSVMVLPRSDRSLIGTMNEAKAIIRDSISCDEHRIGGIDWVFIENEVNETPFSLGGYATPHQRLRKLVAR